MRLVLRICSITILTVLAGASAGAADLVPVRVDGQYGFLTPDLEFAIPPRYLSVRPFGRHSNTAVRYDVGTVGIIDSRGNELLRLHGHGIYRVFENVFLISQKSGNHLYRHDTGEVIATNIRRAYPTSNDRIPVVFHHDGRATYLDVDGSDIFPEMNFRTTYPYETGIAFVQEKDWYLSVIDEDGGYVRRDAYTRVDTQFSEGLAYAVDVHGNRGYVNTDLDFQISLPDSVGSNESISYTSFSGGYAAYRQASGGGLQTWNVIDRSGRPKATGLAFHSMGRFVDGYSLVSVFEDGGYKWNFVDPSGDLLSPSFFTYAEPFVGGYAIIEQDGRDGVISESGRITLF